jgi:hypothetical protein
LLNYGLTKGQVSLRVCQAECNDERRFLLHDDVKKKGQVASRRTTRKKFRLKIFRSVEWRLHRRAV